MRRLFLFIAIISITLGVVTEGAATEYMALSSGKSCSYCHLDPGGGGELTANGDIYLEQLYTTDDIRAEDTFRKIFVLIAGYLHILFAVLWFGTVLYVHIVLKPAYAAKGLPRGEKMVGVISFWTVGITGIILTYDRISSWSQLIDTRFGVLLSIKIGLYLLMMVSAIFVIKIISPRLSKKSSKEHVPGTPFTQQTLSTFDGKEGRLGYFAYNGKVYDTSDSKMWAGGEHMKRHAAGEDLTEALSMAPHNEDVISRLNVVGEFSTEQSSGDNTGRQFYFIAHMNLGIVLIILFILSLWKWG